MEISPGTSTPNRLRVDAQGPTAGGRVVIVSPTGRPRLSWLVPLHHPGHRQTAFRVLVCQASADPRFEEQAVGSGIVSSDVPAWWMTAKLDPHTQYCWTVSVQDDRGEWSEFAAPAQFETGAFSLADWAGSWVSHQSPEMLRMTFDLTTLPFRARLNLAAQGLVRAVLNGTEVNSDSLDPSRTDRSRALYRCFDVSDLCEAGVNTLDFKLGSGEWHRSGLDPRLLADIVADLKDGSRVHVGTGKGMLSAPGQVLIEEPLYLEHQVLNAGEAQFKSSPALRVFNTSEVINSANAPPNQVEADSTQPVRFCKEYVPTELHRVDEIRVFDIGTNIAGRSRAVLRTPLADGITVRIAHGEILGSDGRLDTTNISMPFDAGRARQVVEYVVRGYPGEILEPVFAYHGFRYIEVTGLPEKAELFVTARAMHTDLDQISVLETDAANIGILTDRSCQTFLNNVHGVPEDCPTREQSAWTGDSAAITELSFSAFDTESFYRKWLGDLRTSQRPDGAIPAIAPDSREAKQPSDPVWGAALHRVLVGHWLHYGDREVVHDNLPALRRWVEFQLACKDDEGVIGLAPISFGQDWLALEQTPTRLLHTAATIESLETLAELEDVVGHDAEGFTRREQASALRLSARQVFFDESNGVFANGSQASNSLAVTTGILTEADRNAAAELIETDVRARGDRISSGFAATHAVIAALGATGRSQAIFDMIGQQDEPGIGAMLNHGPGTLWECWWIDQTNNGTGSLDHVGLGGPFAGWVWQSLAGLRPIAPGYSRFIVDPCDVRGVTTLTVTTRTVRGDIHLSWERNSENLAIEITVPVSSEAVLPWPDGTEVVLGPGSHSLTRPPRDGLAPHRPGVPVAWLGSPVAERPSDVDRARNLMGSISPYFEKARVRDGHLSSHPEMLQCRPAPHAQIDGPILHVVGATWAASTPAC